MKKLIISVLSFCCMFFTFGCQSSNSINSNLNKELLVYDYPEKTLLPNNMEWYNFSTDNLFGKEWQVYRVSSKQEQLLEASKICSLSIGDNFFIITDTKNSKMINLYRQYLCKVSAPSCFQLNSHLIEENNILTIHWENINNYIGVKGCAITEKSLIDNSYVSKYNIFENNAQIIVTANLEIRPIYTELLDSTIILDYNEGKDSQGNAQYIWKYYYIYPQEDSYIVWLPNELSIYPHKDGVLASSFSYDGNIILTRNDSGRLELIEGVDISDYFGKTLYANYI